MAKKSLKLVMLFAIVLVAIVTMIGCATDNYLTERQLLTRLRRNLPGRNFEIIDYSRFTTGILLPDENRMRYTVKCLDTEIVFVTQFGHGSDYVRALWGEHVRSAWSEGFLEIVEDVTVNIYPTWIRRDEDDRINEFSFGIRGINPYGDSSSNNPFFNVSNLEFIEQIIEDYPTFEALMIGIRTFEQPMNTNFSLSFHVLVNELEQEYEIARVRQLFREFVLPIQAQIDEGTENQNRTSVRIIFGTDNSKSLDSRVGEFNWENHSSLTLENLDTYDFSRYFSRWENRRIIPDD